VLANVEVDGFVNNFAQFRLHDGTQRPRDKSVQNLSQIDDLPASWWVLERSGETLTMGLAVK
jgi:hypothetical protein